jgi:voltage-gated potassium channel
MRRWSGVEHGFVYPVIIFIGLIVFGGYAYHYIEGWSYLDALYFSVITATTVGYGDLVPVTPLGKIFTIIYAFLIIGIAFYFFTLVGRYFFKKGVHRTHLNATPIKQKNATRRVHR